MSLVSAFFVSLAAIITGHIALSQIKKTGEQGRGLAIAGLIIGYIGLVVGIIVVDLLGHRARDDRQQPRTRRLLSVTPELAHDH